jgi:hypothetical protein
VQRLLNPHRDAAAAVDPAAIVALGEALAPLFMWLLAASVGNLIAVAFYPRRDAIARS